MKRFFRVGWGRRVLVALSLDQSFPKTRRIAAKLRSRLAWARKSFKMCAASQRPSSGSGNLKMLDVLFITGTTVSDTAHPRNRHMRQISHTLLPRLCHHWALSCPQPMTVADCSPLSPVRTERRASEWLPLRSPVPAIRTPHPTSDSHGSGFHRHCCG